MLFSPYRLMHWMFGGKLYHCVFCRLQFYDSRALAEMEPGTPSNTAKMAS